MRLCYALRAEETTHVDSLDLCFQFYDFLSFFLAYGILVFVFILTFSLLLSSPATKSRVVDPAQASSWDIWPGSTYLSACLPAPNQVVISYSAVE